IGLYLLLAAMRTLLARAALVATTATLPLAVAVPAASAHDHGGRYRTVAYFTQWGIYGRNYLPRDIGSSAGRLDVIDYAFGNVSAAALTPASRRAFVASCLDLFLRGDLPVLDGVTGGKGAAAGVFDGIDIDWEWPASAGNDGNVVRPEDRRNFPLLLAELRRQ